MKRKFYDMRRKCQMTSADMARHLGIPEEVYSQIEKGEREMPREIANKFFEKVGEYKNNPSMAKLEYLQQEQKVNDYYDRMLADDRKLLNIRLEQFNIDDYYELSVLMGYSRKTCGTYFAKDSQEVPYIFKNKFYNFLNNELNKQVNKVRDIDDVEMENATKNEIHKRLFKISKEDGKYVRRIIEDHVKNGREFCDNYDVAKSTFYTITGGKPLGEFAFRKFTEALDKFCEDYGIEELSFNISSSRGEDKMYSFKKKKQLEEINEDLEGIEFVEVKPIASCVESHGEKEMSLDDYNDAIVKALEERDKFVEEQNKLDDMREIEEKSKTISEQLAIVYNNLRDKLPKEIADEVFLKMFENFIG